MSEGPTDVAATLLKAFPFEPHWSLRNRHVQTMFQTLSRYRGVAWPEHVVVPTADGDALDVYLDDAGGVHEGRPLLLVLHGLEGNQRSPNVQRLRGYARAKGWSVAALVQRSCGRELNSTKRLYHSGETSDLATVVDFLVRRSPGRRLLLAGYSLGGNQVAKWLGSEGAALSGVVSAAAVVSPPFDLTVTAPAIDRALVGFYRRAFLKQLVPKALRKARQHPGLMDDRKLRAIRSLRDFDNAVTAVLHGFADANDYYRQSGCAQYLSGVARPLLVIAAEDDPFTPGSSIPRGACASNPFICGLFTARGGHTGFVAGTLRSPSFWAEQQVIRFFEHCVERAEGV